MAGKQLGSEARGPKPANQGSNSKAPTQALKMSGVPKKVASANLTSQALRTGKARSGIGGPSGNNAGNKVPGH